MFYLTMHSTHFIYGYMALRTILIVRKETHYRHIGYSYRLTARVLLYAPSHRQDNTYHSLCYTSRGALAGTRIVFGVRCSSMGRTFAHDVSLDQSFIVDPFNYFLFQPVLHDWCNKGCGMCYPVCGVVQKTPCSRFPLSIFEWFFTI